MLSCGQELESFGLILISASNDVTSTSGHGRAHIRGATRPSVSRPDGASVVQVRGSDAWRSW